MFGRGSKTPTQDSSPVEQRPGAKGRPTPKRAAAEAANRRPLVQNDRKLALKRAREERRAEQARVLDAYQTEDQRHLPVRDRGPVRRYVRDLVDRRRNVGQYFLPVAFVVLFLSVLPQTTVVAAIAMYTVLAVLVLDCFLLARTVKTAVAERFGDAAAQERGLRMYAVMRATQMRRMRRPVPKVAHGGTPRS
ncbi:DUF3043 domain-containing protein [Aquipuribacter nitratireducens]|uniref:DUF3043 domain-containing protein n=1 Tax=Aquipuribacter nitratireducens TaxID=650104 RepID=A0ABW0GLI5_9MICO